MRAAMGAVVADGFDFSPGAQVPVSGGAGETAATQALASAAYRDCKLSKISEADSDSGKSDIKKPKLPLTGFWPLYVRAMVVAPVIGWWWAKQICEKAAVTMRGAWQGLLEGGGVAAKIPEAVPQDPNQTAAESLRQNLAKVSAEQSSN